MCNTTGEKCFVIISSFSLINNALNTECGLEEHYEKDAQRQEKEIAKHYILHLSGKHD